MIVSALDVLDAADVTNVVELQACAWSAPLQAGLGVIIDRLGIAGPQRQSQGKFPRPVVSFFRPARRDALELASRKSQGLLDADRNQVRSNEDRAGGVLLALPFMKMAIPDTRNGLSRATSSRKSSKGCASC